MANVPCRIYLHQSEYKDIVSYEENTTISCWVRDIGYKAYTRYNTIDTFIYNHSSPVLQRQ